MTRDFIVTKSLNLEVHRSESGGFFERWIAEWRTKDDPTYYECENCAGSDAPPYAYGWTRKAAIKNAKRILQERADKQAKKLRLAREADRTLSRVKVEIDVTRIKLEESNG